MNEKLNKVLNFLTLSSDEAKTEQVVKLAEVKLEDNETILVADEFKEGNPIFIKSTEEDSENVALPVGEYTLENGDMLVVEVEGEILSITTPSEEPKEEEAPVEEVEEELAEEETPAEEPIEEEVPNHDDKMAQLEARLVALEELLAPAEDLVEVKEEVEMSKEEVVVEEVVELSEEVTFSPEATTPNSKEGKFNFPKGMLGNKMGKSYTF